MDSIYKHVMDQLDSATVWILFVVFVWSFFSFNCLGTLNKKRYPKGPLGVPILGNLPFFGRSPLKTFYKWRSKYGNIYTIRMGSWKTVVVNGYPAIKEAADKPDDDFSGRPAFMTPTITASIRGEQSFAFGPFNQKYLIQRKLAAAALRKFTTRFSNVTEEIIVEEANSVVNLLLSRDYSEPRDIRPDIQHAAISVIFQVLYGRGNQVERHMQLKSIIEAVDKFIKFSRSGNLFDVMPWLSYIMPWKVKHFTKLLTETNEIGEQQIKEHIEHFSKDNVKDITDALLAADLDTCETSNTTNRLLTTLGSLQGAGFDTTNKALQWLLLYMACYPDVQMRVQKEIDDVLGSGKALDVKDRKKLVYTEATIHEVMRITTQLPLGLPKYTTRDTKLDGYDIDKGTVVFFNLHSVSHDKDFWGDPDIFRPSRFLTNTNQLDIAKCARPMPFGIGRRRCVGEFLAKMEIFILFVTIMRRCCIVKPENVEFDLQPIPGLVYSPGEFKVIVKER